MWVPGRGGPCSALPGVSRSSFSLYRKGATPGQCKGTNTKCTELVLGNMFAKLAVAVAFSNSCWLNLMPTPKGSSERAEKQPRLSYAGSLGWPSQPTNACGRRSAFHMDPGRRLCQGIRPNRQASFSLSLLPARDSPPPPPRPLPRTALRPGAGFRLPTRGCLLFFPPVRFCTSPLTCSCSSVVAWPGWLLPVVPLPLCFCQAVSGSTGDAIRLHLLRVLLCPRLEP